MDSFLFCLSSQISNDNLLFPPDEIILKIPEGPQKTSAFEDYTFRSLQADKILNSLSLGKKQVDYEELMSTSKPIFIQIAPKTRKAYLKCKKGSSQETNQLSINVHTFIRSLQQELIVFFDVDQQLKKRFEEFKNSKPNMNSIRRLLQYQKKDEPQNGQNMKINRNQKFKNFRQYLLDKINSSEVIQYIWKSPKMSMKGKITFIKYLEALSKLCENPEEELSWKKIAQGL